MEGFLELNTARVIDYVNGLQEKGDLVGNIFEIGVQHGRTTILLASFIKPGRERLIVNDLFDLQNLNVSSSGCGSEKLFLRNISRFFKRRDFLTILKKPSQELDLQETTTRCRIFVIDGGHTAEETSADLETARRALLEGGVLSSTTIFPLNFPAFRRVSVSFLLRTKSSFLGCIVLLTFSF